MWPFVLFRGIRLKEQTVRNYGKLKRNNDFTRLYRSGKSVKGRSAVILVKGNRHGSTRIGFSVSKKIGNAVKRNRCRRRLKEAVFTYNDRIVKGYDIVFVARYTDKELSFNELCRDVGYLLGKSEVLSKNEKSSDSIDKIL